MTILTAENDWDWPKEESSLWPYVLKVDIFQSCLADEAQNRPNLGLTLQCYRTYVHMNLFMIIDVLIILILP